MKMEVTSLPGLEVYTTKGRYLGKVDDVVINPVDKKISGLAVSEINRDVFDVETKGVIIPFRWVTAIGDIILVREITKKGSQPKE